MKKTFFSLLMLAAMFMIASCGSKSNSGEATEATQATQEQEQVKEVTFTDPAFEFESGIDLTSYFSAESVTPPIRIEDNGHQRISFTAKLKLIKPIENVEGDWKKGYFSARLCDENESPLATAIDWFGPNEKSKFMNAEVGKVFSINFRTRDNYGDNMFEDEMNEVIKKIRKITILQETY